MTWLVSLGFVVVSASVLAASHIRRSDATASLDSAFNRTFHEGVRTVSDEKLQLALKANAKSTERRLRTGSTSSRTVIRRDIARATSRRRHRRYKRQNGLSLWLEVFIRWKTPLTICICTTLFTSCNQLTK